MSLRTTALQFDVLTHLEDGDAAITATGAGQVSASAAEIDVAGDGAIDGNSVVEGNLVVEVTAMDTANGDETYSIILQGSNAAGFATNMAPLATLQLGDPSALLGGADETAAVASSATGRYVIPFRNEKNGVSFRYLRAHFVLAGTSPSITCNAFLSV